MFFSFFLLFVYVILFAYAITRHSFFTKSGITTKYLLLGYGIKLFGGFAYGYIYSHWYSGGDTWEYFDCSKLMYDAFYVNPRYYFQLVFGSCNYTPTDAEFLKIITPIAHWSDERTYFILRINAILQWFSFGNYYVHTVFWVFFSMLGTVAFYRTLKVYFPNYTIFMYVLLFLQPSIFFWASGVHKDGLTLMALGLYVFACQKILFDYEKWQFYGVIILCLGMFYYFRPHLVLLLLPATIAWFLSEWYKWQAKYTFVATYLVSALLLVLLSYLSMDLNVFRKLMQIQYVFILYLHGEGDISIPFLQPTWQSALVNVPMALYNTLITPFSNGIYRSVQHQLATTESLVLLLLILWATISYYLRPIKLVAFWYFCMALSITFLLLIGLTTDNIGAIVRYRTIILPLLTPALGILTGLTNQRLGIKE